MAKTIKCPECEKKISVPDDVLGKRIKCKGCETVFTAKEEVEAKTPRPAPRPRPMDDEDDDRTERTSAPTICIMCGNCQNEQDAPMKLVGKKMACKVCGLPIDVPVPPKPVIPAGKVQCPSCEAIVKRMADPGLKQECQKCKYRFKVPMEEPVVKAPEPSGFEDLSGEPTKTKGKKNDKTPPWIWWPLSEWNWKQWVLAIIVIILLLNVISAIFWKGEKTRPGQPAETAAMKKAKEEAEALKVREDALKAKQDAADAKAKADAEEAKRQKEAKDNEAKLAKLREADEKAKAEAKAKEPKSIDGYFSNAKMKLTYQGGRSGEWKVEKCVPKGDGFEFTGTFSHPFNKNDGTLTGTVTKEGKLEASLTVYNGKVKELEFAVQLQVPVNSGKVAYDAKLDGKLQYSFIRELNGKPKGIIPVGERRDLSYSLVKEIVIESKK